MRRAPEPAKQPRGRRVDGVVQLCTVARLRGWVYGEDATDLDVFINGQPLARIRCTKPGPELVQAGLPLDAGFELRFPRPLHRSDIVSVRFAHGAELRNSPTAPIRHEGALDVCTTSRLAGWAVLDGEPAEVEILVNGERIASIRCTEPRADLAQEGVPEIRDSFSCFRAR